MPNIRIEIVRKGEKWAPIVNGKVLQALSAVEVCQGLEVYISIPNEFTINAPKQFWVEVEKAQAQGGPD